MEQLTPIDDHGNTHVGVCHICHERTNIAYCTVCKHWFGYCCRSKWWSRSIEAIREVIRETQRGADGRCCGPEA